MAEPTIHGGGTPNTCTAQRHGTASAYRRGCRCDAARLAVSRYEKQRNLDILRGRQRTLSNVGAVRRLRALRALGYTARDLAQRVGVDERNIARWPHRAWISRTHHDAVCRVYAELADTPGPDTRSRKHAQRQGWPPPSAWDPDEIDDPAATPQWSWLACTVDLCERPVTSSGYCNAHYIRWRRHGHPLAGGSLRRRGIEGVWARIDKASAGGCWLWTGAATEGYGYVTLDRESWRVHRLVYELLVGPIPDGLTLDHLCHTHDLACAGGAGCVHRRCVNPEHLEPVEDAENKARGGNARKSHCLRGHTFDAVVTDRKGRTSRRCLTCHRDRERARRPHKYDVDEVNVRRALAGQTVNLTRAERLEAVRELRGRRLGYDAIAARLGVSARQVHRDLTALGLVRHEEATA